VDFQRNLTIVNDLLSAAALPGKVMRIGPALRENIWISKGL